MLISVIFVVLILSALVFSVNYGGYLVRMNVLRTTSKEESTALANACVEHALLNLALASSTYQGNQTVAVGSSTCQIFPIQSQSGEKIITTKGVSGSNVTNMKVSVQFNPNLSLVAWEEIPSL
ncbi:MAG: hypothetical protein KGI50_04325 [Patescibacteria group bacterium]|nr:hypothetical protein [Patescibacteria group bacterium]MDE2438488.1 hypothetical protein [Patescibacteria group bacterium]